MIETTALGAAGLAGIGGGIWRDVTEFIGTRQFTRFTPAMEKSAAAGLVQGWQRAVRAALSWARDKGEDSVGKTKRTRAAKRKAGTKSAAKSPAKSKSARGRAR